MQKVNKKIIDKMERAKTLLAEISEDLSGEAERATDYQCDRSARWQESERGEAYNDFILEIEAIQYKFDELSEEIDTSEISEQLELNTHL